MQDCFLVSAKASPSLSLSVLQILPPRAGNCSAGAKRRHGESYSPKRNRCWVSLGRTQPALLLQGRVMAMQPGGTRGPSEDRPRGSSKSSSRGRPTATVGRAALWPRPPHSQGFR